MMKKTLVSMAAVLAVSLLPGMSHAEDAPAAAAEAAPASPLTFNVGVVSDYRYRGISQSRLKPAVQGGLDYAGPGGIYLGTWLSSIKWIKDAGGKDDVEWDLYGGWKGDVGAGLTLDVGLLSYVYPGNKLTTSANTTEVYGALSYSVVTVKYSHSVTDLFGFADSKNSGYIEAAAAFDLGSGWSLTPHVGHQAVKKNSDYSYTDYSLTVGKDFGNGLSLSLALVGTNTKTLSDGEGGSSPAYPSPTGKDLGRNGPVLGLKYSF